MLNYVAISVLACGRQRPAAASPGSPSPITHDVGNAALPIVLGGTGHLGIIIALAMVAVVWWLLFRTTLGFEIRTVGANPDAARYAGMRPRRLIVLTMSMCGAAGRPGRHERAPRRHPHDDEQLRRRRSASTRSPSPCSAARTRSGSSARGAPVRGDARRAPA